MKTNSLDAKLRRPGICAVTLEIGTIFNECETINQKKWKYSMSYISENCMTRSITNEIIFSHRYTDMMSDGMNSWIPEC